MKGGEEGMENDVENIILAFMIMFHCSRVLFLAIEEKNKLYQQQKRFDHTQKKNKSRVFVSVKAISF